MVRRFIIARSSDLAELAMVKRFIIDEPRRGTRGGSR
jgi:hypothetical protein